MTEKDKTLEELREFIRDNPDKVLARIFGPTYAGCLESFLAEVKRVKKDPDQLNLAFKMYASYNTSIISREEKVKKWSNYITTFLGDLQKRRYALAHAADDNFTNDVLTPEDVHLAYMGFVERIMYDHKEQYRADRAILNHLGDNDVNLKDVFEIQKIDRDLGILTEDRSYKEFIQESLEIAILESDRYKAYLDLLERNAENENYEFKFPSLKVVK